MLGERLIELRKKQKLTQQDVSERLHLSRSTYAQYEINRRVPEYGTLEKLADFFHVSIDYLVGRNPEPTIKKDVPDFATAKDKRDFKKFLEQQEVQFDGMPMSEEDKAKVLGFMEGMFWEAKQMNKRKKKDEEKE